MTHPEQPPAAVPPTSSALVGIRPRLAGVRALVESAVIAVVASSVLYLVGFVYVDVFYGRMSIDAASLDLAPPYIALQSLHAVDSIASYPIYLLLVYWAYRRTTDPSGRLAGWYGRISRRLGRLLPALFNLATILPMVLLLVVEYRRSSGIHGSVIGEVSDRFGDAVIVLVIYAVWQGLRAGKVILTQLRERNLVATALLFGTYLLSTLIGTAHAAALQAETLMTGHADSSMEVTLVMKGGAAPIRSSATLILVAVRPDGLYLVEQQAVPPDGRPTAFVVPLASIELVRLRRINAAGTLLQDEFDEDNATPFDP